MLAGLYMLYVIIMTLLNPKLAPQLPAEERNVPVKAVLVALLTSFAPLAGLIGAALGSIISASPRRRRRRPWAHSARFCSRSATVPITSGDGTCAWSRATACSLLRSSSI